MRTIDIPVLHPLGICYSIPSWICVFSHRLFSTIYCHRGCARTWLFLCYPWLAPVQNLSREVMGVWLCSGQGGTLRDLVGMLRMDSEFGRWVMADAWMVCVEAEKCLQHWGHWAPSEGALCMGLFAYKSLDPDSQEFLPSNLGVVSLCYKVLGGSAWYRTQWSVLFCPSHDSVERHLLSSPGWRLRNDFIQGRRPAPSGSHGKWVPAHALLPHPTACKLCGSKNPEPEFPNSE